MSLLTTAPTAQLTVGELARQSVVAPSAVRFYEQRGLITAERTTGNQRRFHPTNVCRIKIIRVAQRIGLSVEEIKEHLDDMPTVHEASAADWQRLGERLVDDANRRIRELIEAVDDLTSDGKLCELPPVAAPRPVESQPHAHRG